MPPLLELDRVNAAYGRVRVLHDLSLVVPEGAVVALLGANGAGKTTTLRVISGTLAPAGGDVRVDGMSVRGSSAYEMTRRGITLVPEGRGVFPALTVAENLDLAARSHRDRSSSERAAAIAGLLDRFPVLGERQQQKAGTLSGGEQQMLALGRAFLSDARLLLFDEISMGLAPMIVAELFEAVAALRGEGKTVLLVEQFLTYALSLADLCYVMAKGRVVFVGDPGELRHTGGQYLAGAAS
ncbi:MAG: ABC transporter ATP-binding protein [Actinomycetota bacterium]